jgi:hypothetical protein
MTLGINDIQHNNTDIMLSVIFLSAVMLSVVAPPAGLLLIVYIFAKIGYSFKMSPVC